METIIIKYLNKNFSVPHYCYLNHLCYDIVRKDTVYYGEICEIVTEVFSYHKSDDICNKWWLKRTKGFSKSFGSYNFKHQNNKNGKRFGQNSDPSYPPTRLHRNSRVYWA